MKKKYAFLLLLFISCKGKDKPLINKSEFQGNWIVTNINYNSSIASLKQQESRINGNSYIALFSFNKDSLIVLSVDTLQEHSMAYYYIYNDTLYTKLNMTTEEIIKFSDKRDNFYFNKFLIEKIDNNSMTVKSFYPIKNPQAENSYVVNLYSNYYTATMQLRKLNSEEEYNQAFNYLFRKKLNVALNDLPFTGIKIVKTVSDSINNQNVKYGFVVLDVVHEVIEPFGGPSYKNYIYTSSVKEYKDIDEDIKYKILDEFQNYYAHGEGYIHNGTVKNRKILLFNTYSEASREREKYTMSK